MATQDWAVGNRVCQTLSSWGQKTISLRYLCSQVRAPPSEVRAAVRELRQLGYPVTSAGKDGYLVDQEAKVLDMKGLTRHLRSSLVRWAVKRFFYIDSTQIAVRAMAERGAREGTVVLAEMQSRGTGRLGRKWSSPFGGIWMSLLLRPEKAMADQMLTITTSLAIARAVSAACEIGSKLKWPNDVQIGSRKVAGVLGRAEYEGERLRSVTIGLGINANIDLSLLPKSFRDQAASLKRELGSEVDRELLTASVLNNFDSLYSKLKEGDEATIVDEVRKNCNTLGRRIRVRMGSRSLNGVAQNLGVDGSLIVKADDGKVIQLYSDEVTLLS